MKRKLTFGAVAAVILLAAFFYFYSGGEAPPGQPPLERLTASNVANIKNEFNAAKDDVRVLLLLSPT
jgi:hypothetical protein